MSLYRYTSTEERTYVDRALVVEPGDVVGWPDGPPADGHWVPVEDARDAELAARDVDEKATAEASVKATRKTPSAPAAPTIEE